MVFDIRRYFWLDKYATTKKKEAEKKSKSNEYSIYVSVNQDGQLDDLKPEPTPTPSLKDVAKFPAAFWLFSFATTLFYMAIFPFQSTAVYVCT